MKQIGDMKMYSFEEILDEDLGRKGTPGRDAFETAVEADVRAYHIGEAIRQARKDKGLSFSPSNQRNTSGHRQRF